QAMEFLGKRRHPLVATGIGSYVNHGSEFVILHLYGTQFLVNGEAIRIGLTPGFGISPVAFRTVLNKQRLPMFRAIEIYGGGGKEIGITWGLRREDGSREGLNRLIVV